MTSLALSFNEVNFTPIQQDNQIWLKTSELAEALGYADQSGVTRIFSRNEDEFTQAMSCSVKLTEKGQTREIRIFSLRGAHLIAMFARTAIAKQFRKWVLDILDREVVTQQVNSRQTIYLNNKLYYMRLSQDVQVVSVRFMLKCGVAITDTL